MHPQFGQSYRYNQLAHEVGGWPGAAHPRDLLFNPRFGAPVRGGHGGGHHGHGFHHGGWGRGWGGWGRGGGWWPNRAYAYPYYVPVPVQTCVGAEQVTPQLIRSTAASAGGTLTDAAFALAAARDLPYHCVLSALATAKAISGV